MKRVLLLYTGGTIGCEGEPLTPMPAARFAQQLAAQGPLAAECVLHALPRPLDSASMQPGDWLDVQAALRDAWTAFDGFVVLHGTDTLPFTAAALSFLMVGIDKPVVLTGSQYPLAAIASDAPGNLRDAVAVACESSLREVVVCFAGRVLRGNRTVKRSAEALDAFDSPNWPDLGAVAQGAVTLNVQHILPAPASAFAPKSIESEVAGLRANLAAHAVWLVHLHPGFPVALLHAALALPLRGWVLACYGTGNAPESPAFIDALRAAHDKGVALVAVTQTGHGKVDLQTYQAGAGLAAVGVISGGDLTVPTALVKLQLCVASGTSPSRLAQAMAMASVGESS